MDDGLRYRDDPDRQEITVEGTEVCVADRARRVRIFRSLTFIGVMVVVRTPGVVGVGEGVRKGMERMGSSPRGEGEQGEQGEELPAAVSGALHVPKVGGGWPTFGRMHDKKSIVANWLPRYTGLALEEFGHYILLTNFTNYVEKFAAWNGVPVRGTDRAMQSATHADITIINFGMGSANAATVMDLLSAIAPRAVLFLGKCGALREKNSVGDLILPLAGIRGEGTSNDYFPPEVPALPSFALQRAVSSTVRDFNRDYYTGSVYTTNRRVWEHDEKFREYLRVTRAQAIDMETATLFTVGFANRIPVGALLLVTDEPMTPSGVKTEASDKHVTASFVDDHVRIGIESLKELQSDGHSIKHLKWK